MGAKLHINEEVTVAQINNELKSFYDFCKENNFTDEDIKKMCEPLTLSIRKSKLLKQLRFAVIILLVASFLYSLTYLEIVTWNLSAIGRILLIRVLPYWNWIPLKHEKCLISKSSEANNKNTVFDCSLCEAIDRISVEHDINPEFLNDRYIKLHVPVILTDSLENWPYFSNPSYNLTQEILSDKILSQTVPCELSTNTYNGLPTTGKLLRGIHKFSSYFLHFQNCEFDGVKSFRLIAPRPSFFIPEISPVQYSWLLMSNNYNVTKFKSLNLREAITVFGQILGTNVIKLLPINQCATECPSLEIELKQGEALIFTTMWNIEYKPYAKSENIAIILEVH